MLERGDTGASRSRWHPARARLRPGAEALVAAALLALLALAAYGYHIAHGGFYTDDWANAASYHFADAPRYFTAVSEIHQVIGGRPLMALLLALPHALFGLDPAPHLALAALLGVATSLCLFVLLRTLELPAVHAWAIAALVLLFPWSDSLRLWSAASLNSVSVCLFLIGLTIALRGFEQPGRRGTAMHGAATLLYLLSVLTYEVAAVAALAAGILYLGRTPRRVALRAWLADVAAVMAGLLYSLTATVSSRHLGTLSERVGDVPGFTRDFLVLLASALQPFGTMGRAPQALVLLFAAAVVVAAVLQARRAEDPTLRRWLRWMVVGLVAVAAAYVMFLGSNLHPRDPGIDNRINLFAGVGFCLLIYAIAACAAHLVTHAHSTAAALALGLVIAIGYGTRLASDEADWRDAADRQAVVLAGAEAELLSLPRESTLLAFGPPAQVAPGVPVFNRPWDLGGALELRSRGAVKAAYPIYEGVDVSCARRVTIDGGGGYGRFEVSYRRLYMTDLAGGGRWVASRSACEAALRRLRPGPLEQ
jgi:hypothetical protein